jgi:hypothetical protein
VLVSLAGAAPPAELTDRFAATESVSS